MESFADDEDVIPDDDIIYRAIPARWINTAGVPEGSLPEISSQGFQDQPEEVARQEFGLPGACCSVASEGLLRAQSLDLTALLEFFPGYYIAASTAGQVRSLSGANGTPIPQGIMHDPREGRPWHAVVWDKSGKARGKPGRRAFAAACWWVYIPGVGHVSAN